MSSRNISEKFVIAWLDHEKPKVDTIISRIGEMKRMTSTNEYIRDCCELVPIIIKPEALKKLVERALVKIRAEDGRLPDLLLVDLNFGDHASPSTEAGRNLALELRKRLYPMPVGVYTAHQLTNLSRVTITADRFAVILEGITNLYDGGPTIRLMGDDWYNLFGRIISDARHDAASAPSVLTDSDQELIAKWKEGQPSHRAPSFMKIGPKLADLALSWLDPAPDEILLSQLAGGFSGSFVVKASIEGRPASYVIKMDEDPQKLINELAGHQRVKSLIGYQYYLPLVSPDATRPVMLTESWWGAFAMVYEGEARPLIEHPHLSADELAKTYRRLWEECLFYLYGSALPDMEVNPEQVVTEKIKTAAADGWNSLNRYSSNLDLFRAPLKSNIQQALSYLSSPTAHVGHGAINAPWVERVHGDLNCRNVLYNDRDDSFRLIDFPHVGPSNCLAIDFVKAEAELVLIILDWSTGRDCDFSRLDAWGELTQTLSTEFDTMSPALADPEIERVLASIKAIRASYLSRADGTGDAVSAYRLYLLMRVLVYIGYSDLSAAKRFLALAWAGQLLGTSW